MTDEALGRLRELALKLDRDDYHDVAHSGFQSLRNPGPGDGPELSTRQLFLDLNEALEELET